LLAKKDKATNELLKYLDILVDGRFDIKKMAQPGKLFGSTNQRVIDVQQTLKTSKIVLYK
jgi:anaerobic ribonucleoside-triphosphate reductase activating protein